MRLPLLEAGLAPCELTELTMLPLLPPKPWIRLCDRSESVGKQCNMLW